MSFAELADLRGITKESAVSLVRRHRWRRQRDNRGRVLVLVPDDGPEVRQRPPDRRGGDLPAPRANPPEQGIAPADDQSHAVFAVALEAMTKAHAGEVAALTTTIEELKAGQAMIQDMHARELDAVCRQLQEVRDAGDELRQADEARKARGRLRRAWDGWRGR